MTKNKNASLGSIILATIIVGFCWYAFGPLVGFAALFVLFIITLYIKHLNNDL